MSGNEGNTTPRGAAGAMVILAAGGLVFGYSPWGWWEFPTGKDMTTAPSGSSARTGAIDTKDVEAKVPEGMRGCNRQSARSNRGCALAKNFAAKVVKSDAQLACLDILWYNESGWDPWAENPSSGAYGITQALPAEKMRSAGSDWRNNPITQVKWGLNYIERRYGSPCDAWRFWQRTDARPYPGHWY